MNNNNQVVVRNEFSAGVVLFREGGSGRKYLVLHYPGGHFDFPKGHLEKNETEEMAAIRELEEETSVVATELLKNFMIPITYEFHRQKTLVHKKVTFFLAKTESADVKISHEHKGYLWLDYEDALKKITFENARAVLSQAEEYLQKKHEV